MSGGYIKANASQPGRQAPTPHATFGPPHPDHIQDLNKSGLTPEDLRRFGVGVWSLTPTDL
jgi:hypothetical protein